MTELLLLLALAAWVGVDATAALQLMVSQPLVAAWLAGTIVGAPAAGLAVGLLLQVAWGRSLPLGGASFPVAGPAAVVAGATAAHGSQLGTTGLGGLVIPDVWTLALALALGLGIGELGRPGVQALRRRRGGLVMRGREAGSSGHARPLMLASLAGAAQNALLGIVLVTLGLALGALGLGLLPELPEPGTWVFYAVLGAGLGHGFTSIAPRRGGRVLVILLVAGSLAWRLIR